MLVGRRSFPFDMVPFQVKKSWFFLGGRSWEYSCKLTNSPSISMRSSPEFSGLISTPQIWVLLFCIGQSHFQYYSNTYSHDANMWSFCGISLIIVPCLSWYYKMIPVITGCTIRTLLYGKINPKDWQVLSLGDVGFLLFFRVVSGDYGKPCITTPLWKKNTHMIHSGIRPSNLQTGPDLESSAAWWKRLQGMDPNSKAMVD